MRFFARGPSIPQELLEARDQGRVVFFCGAGISMPALPGFRQLASRVLTELDTPVDAASRQLFEEKGNLDQVFNHLESEYRRSTVEKIVRNLLRTPRSSDLSKHSIVLRLSRNTAKRVQVVTTNFDLLFEAADRRLKTHVA